MLKHGVALGIFALGCATKFYPITNEPDHHQVMRNDQVRVFDVHVAPHTSTRMHVHSYDYLFVTLGAATVTSAPYHRSPTQLALHDGEVRFSKAPLIHIATNDGDQEFHNTTIELLHPSTTVKPCALPCVYTADQWTVSSVSLAPSAHLDVHDALVVSISGTPGEVRMVQGALTNAEPSEARFVVVEFK
jgi:quercetin dioxygenase-like cupin family protein